MRRGSKLTRTGAIRRRRLPIDHVDRNAAVAGNRNIGEIADISSRRDEDRMSLCEGDSAGGCGVDLLTTWDFDLFQVDKHK